MSPDQPRSSPGLRERKKAKTRDAIRRHALRLYREQGYEATTVEQIAEAAEVSQSTFFRYYSTKEGTVISDGYERALVAEFLAQPADMPPATALRTAMRTILAQLTDEDRADLRFRTQLSMEVPQLRAASLATIEQTIRLVGGAVAKRLGRDPEDLAVRSFAGATFGVMIAGLHHWAAHPEVDILAAVDEAMGRLEAGLPV